MGEREIVKPIIIELGGEEWELKIDLAAMHDFEGATGKSVVQFVAPILGALRGAIEAATNSEDTTSSIDRGISAIEGMAEADALAASDLMALLWACLGGEDSGLTRREVGRLVGIGNIADVAVQIYRAIIAALPTGKGKAAETDDDSKNAG